MSEILSSVYRLMERTGLQEGILFLDEINCVSETLAPMMLQFLQCKTFGNQALPEGWLIVAAATRRSTTAPSGSSTSLPGTGSSASTWSRTSMPGRSLPTKSTSIRR